MALRKEEKTFYVNTTRTNPYPVGSVHHIRHLTFRRRI